MDRSISKRHPVKASASKPLGNPLPGYKTLVLEPNIRVYEIENSDKTEEGEDSEILIIHNKSLAPTKQKLVKRKFPYINTFDHQVTTVVSTIHYLTSVVFEHL